MTQVKEEQPVGIRLQPLTSVIDHSAGIDGQQLLNHCARLGINVFTAVPPGHVVAIRHPPYMERAPSRSRKESAQAWRSTRPWIVPDVRYVQLDPSDVVSLRDAGAVDVREFYHGGLAHMTNGLLLMDFWSGLICVERSDPVSPKPISLFSVRLSPYNVDPVEQRYGLDDLFVSADDVRRLQREGGVVKDRWGHKDAAPSVFLVYKAAHYVARNGYNQEKVVEWLQAHDEQDVFTKKVAEFAARLIKKDAAIKSSGKTQLEESFRLISDNELGKDYREDIASNRLSLLHLATDTWLHDQKNPSAEPLLPPKGGVRAFLANLGFSDAAAKQTQADLLRRIIENEKGGGNARKKPAPV